MDVRHSKKILSFSTVKDKPIDRTFFFKDKTRRVYSYFSKALQELYSGVWSAFAFDQVNINSFKSGMMPIVSSGAVILLGNATTKKMSHYYTESEEYDFVFKFLLALAILSYSALHRVTDKKIKTTTEFSLAVASEVMAIVYLYSSSFQGTQCLLQEKMSDNYSLITGLGMSGIVVPGMLSYATKKIQNQLVKRDNAKGAQRSDTALISSGLTPVINTFLLIHYFLLSEMNVSRFFQLVLIADSILRYKNKIKQYRDVPSFCVDIGPQIIKNIMEQQARIKHDYTHNTKEYYVLQGKKNKYAFSKVQGSKLRNGDLVFCKEELIDLSSMPVSGEIVALKQNPETLEFFPQVIPEKISTNLQKHNGESNWIEVQTKSALTSDYKSVDLHAIHEGKQAAVLVGSKLNLFGKNNFFVQIKPANEYNVLQGHEKSSVIIDIITQHKKQNVLYSILFSIFVAGMLTRDFESWPATTLRLLFHLFQMMIPFSESVLREMVARRILNRMNVKLTEPLKMNQVMHNVDACNAFAGYYQDKFPKGVAIITDKTGTLTTSEMKVLGIWTTEMKQDVQSLLREEKSYLLPGEAKRFNCAERFAWIFTNQKSDLEPEESAMKQFIADFLGNNNFLEIDTRGNNHYRKRLTINHVERNIETWHLGLYKKLGGRLTLVDDGEKKRIVFCGVPNAEVFCDTQFFKDYSGMRTRTGVLSRDWCIAESSIDVTNQLFQQLLKYFEKNDKKPIEEFFRENKTIFSHVCTFLIDNPLKKGAEKFIGNFRGKCPIYPATGDTCSAAENIDDILNPENKGRSIIRNEDILQWNDKPFNRDITIIFVGVNDEVLKLFKRILDLPPEDRPVVIFSEMSTKSKGILAAFLKQQGFFVIAIGDGRNDVEMMQEAHAVYAHLTDEGTYAPGVENYADLNDRQLQKMCSSTKSFYELFDFYKSDSQIEQLFSEMATSLEKVTITLELKITKMSFEMAKAIGLPVREMWQQHLVGVLYDVSWVFLSFLAINESTDRPMDNKHLCKSNFSMQVRAAAFAIAALQASISYLLNGETTHIYFVVTTLAFLPLVLKSIFSAFGHLQDETTNEKTSSRYGFKFFDWRSKSDSAINYKPDNHQQSAISVKPA